jgi:hypothetical protein
MRRKLWLYLAACLPILCTSSSALDEQSLIDDFTAKLRTLLLTLGAAPLFGSNYHVGDVWDVTMTHLIERENTCFPGLETRISDASIMAVNLKDTASAGLAFRVKRFFNLAGSGTQNASVTMFFEDVSDEIASEGDLRHAFKSNACADATSILDGKQLSPSDPANVIIGRILRGKRRVFITYEHAASADAMAEQLTAASLSLPVSIQAEVSMTSGQTISLIDKASVPLAFSPAFVPVRSSGVPQGPGENSDVQYQWQPFSIERFPSEKESLSELGSATSWKWEDQDAQGK